MKLSVFSRIILIASSALLFSSIFMPIWRIELSAPQYPEGLALLIFTDKLGGDVDIINGLNHYIGMQTLHTENFIEFTILPYLVGIFSLLTLLVALFANKKMLYTLFIAFICFGIIAMSDFYRWNYNYGHHLDPHAAIVVPGMAYQPPLIGYKQLLNFGAFSIPDKGGWLFIGAGMLMLLAWVLTYRQNKMKNTRGSTSLVVVSLLILLASCGTALPKPVKLNKDNCHFCKMTIVDEKFVAEIITKKGRYYFFDDISCMVKYKKANKNTDIAGYYAADFSNPASFVLLEKAIILKSEKTVSPMGGNMVVFAKQNDADAFIKENQATVVIWADLIK